MYEIYFSVICVSFQLLFFLKCYFFSRYLDRNVRLIAAWSLFCSCTQSCQSCFCRNVHSPRCGARTHQCLRAKRYFSSVLKETSSKEKCQMCVRECCLESDLCMLYHPAAAWSPPGSCTEHLWMCPYRCCHSLHCSLHTSLKSQHVQLVTVCTVNDLPS